MNLVTAQEEEMLPVRNKCRVYEVCVCVKRKDCAGLLWLPASFDEFHIRELAGNVGKEPVVDRLHLGTWGKYSTVNVSAICFQCLHIVIDNWKLLLLNP